MFTRLIFEHWQLAALVLSFGLSVAVFFVFFVYALRLRKSEVERLAALPLENERIISSHEE